MIHTDRRILPCLVFAALLFWGCGGGGGGGEVAQPEPNTGFRVLEMNPFDGELFVSVESELVATFSDPLILGTIDESNFLLNERASGREVLGAVSLSSDRLTATFRPAQDLLRNTGYRIRILPDVTSIAGSPLSEEVRTVFTTAIDVEPPPDPPPPAQKGKLRVVGDMKVGRSSHTATLLNDGNVLITGGFESGSSLTKTAEIFNYGTESFKRTADDLTLARAFHTATKLTDGQVLILGGVAGSGFAETLTAEIYDPSKDLFWAPTNYMANARAFHTATLMHDGRVLIVGGTVPTPNGSFSSKKAEIYDPNPGGTPFFKTLPDTNVYRAGHTATRLSDGTVYLIGGNSSDKRIEMYDPLNDQIILRQGVLKTARRGHTTTLLPDGNILVMGGGERSAEIYLTLKDYFVWAPGYPTTERRDHTANFTTDGYLLFTGGARGIAGDNQNPLFFNRNTEMYDPATGAFLPSSPLMLLPRTRHCGTTLSSGKILITGGANTDGTQPELDSAEIFEAE